MKRVLFWAIFSFQIAGYAFGENSDINYALCQTTEHLKSVLRERFPKNPKWELPENNYKDADSIIFSHLDKLRLRDGHTIHIELWDVMFKLNKDAYSCPYIEVGQGQKDYDYIKYVQLEDLSEQSLWQWILLYEIKNMLPNERPYSGYSYKLTNESWQSILNSLHENYVIPDSIWEREEIEAGSLSEKEFKEMTKAEFSPIQISVNASTQTAEIFFHTWCSWSGLKKIHYRLEMQEDKTIKILNRESENIVKYSCGIIF